MKSPADVFSLKTENKIIFFLIFLPFFWYFRILFSDACFFLDDLMAQNNPWWTYAQNRFNQGQFPLWNPYVFGGMPYHTNPQAFYFTLSAFCFFLFLFLKQQRCWEF